MQMIQLEIEQRSKIYAKHTSLYNKRCLSGNRKFPWNFIGYTDILIIIIYSYKKF